MLASKPTSGLLLRAMIDCESSRRKMVRGFGWSSSQPSAGSGTYSNASKRFFGLEAEPRPAIVGGVFMRTFTPSPGGAQVSSAQEEGLVAMPWLAESLGAQTPSEMRCIGRLSYESFPDSRR